MHDEVISLLWESKWYSDRGDNKRASELIVEAIRWHPEEDDDPPVGFSKESLQDTIVRLASREVGQKEVGNNGGAAVRKYQRATWLDPGSWPWCAAFVCWVMHQVEQVHEMRWKVRPRTAGAYDFENWARKRSGGEKHGVTLIKPRKGIRAGDIVVFRFSHIGIAVEDDSAGTVATVEGNTDGGGSREGDGVYRKDRKVNQIRSVIRLT